MTDIQNRTPPPVEPYAIPSLWPRVLLLIILAFACAAAVGGAIAITRIPPADINTPVQPREDARQVKIDHDDGWTTIILCKDGRGLIDCNHEQVVTYQGKR